MYSKHNIGTGRISVHNHIIFSFIHRLNIELDLLKFIWAPAVLIGRDPTTTLLPPELGSYTRALLVSQDLFVTPWLHQSAVVLAGSAHVSVQVAGSDFFHPESRIRCQKKIPDPQQRV
jgi:hypothetical protein